MSFGGSGFGFWVLVEMASLVSFDDNGFGVQWASVAVIFIVGYSRSLSNNEWYQWVSSKFHKKIMAIFYQTPVRG